MASDLRSCRPYTTFNLSRAPLHLPSETRRRHESVPAAAHQRSAIGYPRRPMYQPTRSVLQTVSVISTLSVTWQSICALPVGACVSWLSSYNSQWGIDVTTYSPGGAKAIASLDFVILSRFLMKLFKTNNNAWESEIACTLTDDVWWNFHVWKFHKLMGRPNRDGQSRRPQGLWSIAPPVYGGLEPPLAVGLQMPIKIISNWPIAARTWKQLIIGLPVCIDWQLRYVHYH